MTTPTIAPLPGQPNDKDGPVFQEVWEAQAFAMAIALHEGGVFTWQEWARTLAGEIKAAQKRGDLDLGTTYYHHWLKALEQLVVQKGIASAGSLHDTAKSWTEAARTTPHGQPIVLSRTLTQRSQPPRR